MLQTVEAKKVMQQCLYHPLIIRIVAQWFKLKQVTFLVKAMEELNLELKMLGNSATAKADTFKVFAKVLNMVMSPARRDCKDHSNVLKLCLFSVVVCFQRRMFLWMRFF
jgi:hypothetical protein